MRARHRRAVRKGLAAVLLLFATLAASGCVERRLFVRSDPPGAGVWIDEEYRGETPLDVTLPGYGTRRIELRKAGFERELFHERVPRPFYQWFPLDFVTEVLIPFRIRDEHRVDRRLRPEPPVTYDRAFADELLRRAEAFRREAD